MMTNKSNKVIYTGCTDNLDERIKEHKLKIYLNSFTARYNCDKLVYFEEIREGGLASKREKQIKKWKRAWKIKLIEEINPGWNDLRTNWNLNLNITRHER